MPTKTGIEWTDYSSNPIRYRDASGRDVWACEKVSAGCTNCYAEALALRMGRGERFNAGNMAGLTPYIHVEEVRKLLESKALSGKRVFIGDMTDVFGSWVDDDDLARLFAAFCGRPDVTFQVLTKRPERMAAFCASLPERFPPRQNNITWPLPNVWLGTSVENQASADERIPHLLRTPAAVRFLSCEPLLGPVDLEHTEGSVWLDSAQSSFPLGIHWIIAGGESGPHARPSHPDWFRSLRDQCQAAGVAFFFKQWGEHVPVEVKPYGSNLVTVDYPQGGRRTPGQFKPTEVGGQSFHRVGKKSAGRELDGRTWDELPA